MTATRIYAKQGFAKVVDVCAPPPAQPVRCQCCEIHAPQMSAIERKSLSLMLRAVYEEQRKQEGRNYAKEHSFEEWLQVP